jgi:uncharacterized membrane protein|tara:strand:+ start:169 stop:555 length:387 start_codon:yes stop_codon:yes gene_type:complete
MLNNTISIVNKKENVDDNAKHEEISICIPRVFKDISSEFITDIFQKKLKLGIVKRIDVISNTINGQFNKVFIHFESWYDNTNAISVQNKLLHDITIKVVYDSYWFWKCVLNKSGPTYARKRKNNCTHN